VQVVSSSRTHTPVQFISKTQSHWELLNRLVFSSARNPNIKTSSTITKMPQAGLAASQQLQQSKQYAALNDHLSANTTAAIKVLDHLSEPVESCVQTSADSDEIDDLLTTTWKSIIAKAAETSFKDDNHSKLVEVVVGLQSRSDVKKDGAAFQVENMTLWKDLPTFGWQMREAWNLGMHC
jgi:hypothetical protein